MTKQQLTLIEAGVLVIVAVLFVLSYTGVVLMDFGPWALVSVLSLLAVAFIEKRKQQIDPAHKLGKLFYVVMVILALPLLLFFLILAIAFSLPTH